MFPAELAQERACGPERCRALTGDVHRDQAGRGAHFRGLRCEDGASPGARGSPSPRGGKGRRCWQETGGGDGY